MQFAKIVLLRRGRDLNPRIEGFADLAIGPLWYRAIFQHSSYVVVIPDLIRNLKHS